MSHKEGRAGSPYKKTTVPTQRRNITAEAVAERRSGSDKKVAKSGRNRRLTVGWAAGGLGTLLVGGYVALGFLSNTPTRDETTVQAAGGVSANGESLGDGRNACIPLGIHRMITEPDGYTQHSDSQLKDFTGDRTIRLLSRFANDSGALNFQAAIEQIETERSMTGTSRRLSYVGERSKGSLDDYIRSCFDPVIAHYRTMAGGRTLAGVLLTEESSVLNWTKDYIENHPRVDLQRQNDVKQMVLNYLDNVARQRPESAADVVKIKEAYLASEAWKKTNLPKE
jgi:hypothetical protein